MSWEELSRKRYPCPCGKGEYEEIHRSDDWGRYETLYEMLCLKCKEDYVYDHTVIYGHPRDEVERGWVLKSVLEEEKRYRKNVENKSKELYYVKWQEVFAGANSKKELWGILSINGKYYPSLGTFYKHNKGKDEEELRKEIDKYFRYHDLKRVFEICKVKPDWKQLGVNDKDREQLKPDNSTSPISDSLDKSKREKMKASVSKTGSGIWIEVTRPSKPKIELKKIDGLILTIELVPRTSWYQNLRKLISKPDWDKTRKQAYADYGYMCGICNADARLNCHEMWEYDDENHVQTLKGFIALCDMCHHVKHFGFAQILASKGELDIDKVIVHFMKVNNCSYDKFQKHKSKSFQEWLERSTHQWQIDLGKYKDITRQGKQPVNTIKSDKENKLLLGLEVRPSEITDTYWLYAERKKGKYPKPTENSGKWLVFVESEIVDIMWAKIKKATEEGKLGESSKVATAKLNKNALNPEEKVICVYTYDWTDKEDVKRIREELRKLGITKRVSYKSDEDTLSERYRVKGDTRISKYYE